MTIGKPFKKGQSGNPGGRPKVAAEVKELAREHTGKAIETMRVPPLLNAQNSEETG